MGDGSVADGIHHVTFVTRRAQANVDFYAGFLGMRLVKRTAGYEDTNQLHLFYGDGVGSPGTLITCLAWEDGNAGRVGLGQPIEIGLAIGADSLGFWLTRCLERGIAHQLPVREFGESVLRLTDPDGIIVKLVAQPSSGDPAHLYAGGGVPLEHAIRRVRSVAILSDKPDETAQFVTRYFGYKAGSREGATQRLVSSNDAIDVRDARGFWPGAPGPGTIDHVAFRARDVRGVEQTLAALRREGDTVTSLKDRHYFTSLYVREPAGVLFELATDGPGMLIDETADTLGEKLFVPPRSHNEAAAIRVVLPQIRLPGEERDMRPDLPFVHRLYRPDNPDGTTLVVLHGTGGNETDLFPLANQIAPRATLLGVRGRSTEEGILRYFRRLTATTFDQDDIKFEAAAFAAFLPDALKAYDLDAARVTLFGYSNGANFAAAVALLYPDLVRRAALLRPMLVLEAPPKADLSRCEALLVGGRTDPFGRYAPELEKVFRGDGAKVTLIMVNASHGLAEEDVSTVRDWLAASNAADSSS